MAIERAQQWLQDHSHTIPALSINHLEITNALEEKQGSKLIQNILVDPGLVLALLCKVNVNRDSGSGRDIVDSPKAAVTLIGNLALQTLVESHPLAENTLYEPHQLFLFQQIINRCFHNKIQSSNWASKLGHQQLEELEISALLIYLGELLCCTHDFDRYQDVNKLGNTEAAAEKCFGFNFFQLTEAVCLAHNLPKLIIRSLPYKDDSDQRAKLISHTSTLCQLSEQGWQAPELQLSFNDFATFLQLPLDKALSQTHEFSVLAARKSIVSGAWQPASRLVLTFDAYYSPFNDNKDTSTTAKSPAADTEEALQKASKNVKTLPSIAQIQQLLKQSNISQSALLTTTIQGLQQDVGFNRVNILLLSKDKTTLKSRMTIGIEDNSPFRQYQIDLSKLGLFKALLKQPQAVWINRETLLKYQKLIPQNFTSTCRNDYFVAMSLFIGNKPIGIVYADRHDDKEPINQQQYSQFKQLISLTSKSLTLHVKRQQSAKA